MVSAPAAAAASSAPSAYGVCPLALIATTASSGHAERLDVARAGGGVVLGRLALGRGRAPRARDERDDLVGGTENVASHSAASSAASAPDVPAPT